MNSGNYTLALDTSLTKFRLGFSCKYLAVSGNSTGQAQAFIDSNWNNPILLYPGFSGLIEAKESLYVDVGPQPGKILQLSYSDNPIIVTSPSRMASEAPLPVNTVFDNATLASPIILIAKALNKRGVKILAGILSANTIAALNSFSIVQLIISLDGGITAAAIISNLEVSSNNAALAQFDSKIIPPIFIPSNYDLVIVFSTSGATKGGYLINYEIL